MNTHADKTQEDKDQSVTNTTSKKQSDGNAAFQQTDNNPQVQQLKAYQKMADNFTAKTAQLKENGDEQGKSEELNGYANTAPESYIFNYANNNWFEALNQFQQGSLHHPKSPLKKSKKGPYGMQKLLDHRTKITKKLLEDATKDVEEHEKAAREKKSNEMVLAKEITKEEAKEFVKDIRPIKGDIPGSDNPTSDIDVNLSGDGTEYAVSWLNHTFLEKYGKGQESGVVYDVNFYAQDFVPEKMFPLKKDGKLNKQKGDEGYINDDKAWRTHVIEDKDSIREDETEQEISSMLMMRVNMGEEDWELYKTVAPPEKNTVIVKAEARFLERSETISKMKKDIKPPIVFKAGNPKEEDAELSNMSAENKVYEKVLLEKVKPARVLFQLLKRQLEAAPENKELQKKVDEAYVQLKTEKTKAMTYANAAYYTEGAVVGVVTNKQQLGRMYKPKKEVENNNADAKQNYKKLKLSAAEYYNGFTEQIGFAFHGLHKVNDKNFFSELALMGKYVHRSYNFIKHLFKDAGINEFPFGEKERRAASDWEGVKQGKSHKTDGSGYSDKIAPADNVEPLIGILESFFGISLPKDSDNALQETIIQSIRIQLIANKATIDHFYPIITKRPPNL
jgi:hypothetical protein